MGLILMLLGISLVLTVLQGVVLAYMWRESQASAVPPLAVPPHVAPSRFFQNAPRPDTQVRPVSLELLLQQLEQHIRLEHDAAESYHWYPTVATLHKHTSSPLLH